MIQSSPAALKAAVREMVKQCTSLPDLFPETLGVELEAAAAYILRAAEDRETAIKALEEIAKGQPFPVAVGTEWYDGNEQLVTVSRGIATRALAQLRREE